MKFCIKCHTTLWPYLIALFIAGFAAFLTWLTLSYSEFDPTEKMLIASGTFLMVAATITHYMIACMERHCRHDQDYKGKKRRPHKIGNRQRPVGV
ncbi:hypothetical protein TI04_04540 [Achromatium sp. WMS2]|nr:hypothetical protein TI04_04540 [Achromatium sp. WMS2]